MFKKKKKKSINFVNSAVIKFDISVSLGSLLLSIVYFVTGGGDECWLADEASGHGDRLLTMVGRRPWFEA